MHKKGIKSEEWFRDLTNLGNKKAGFLSSWTLASKAEENEPFNSKKESKISYNHGKMLKEDGFKGIIIQILHHKHLLVEKGSKLRKQALKPGKKRGVIKSPLWGVLRE